MVSIGKKEDEHVLEVASEGGTCRALIFRLKEGTIVAVFYVLVTNRLNTYTDERSMKEQEKAQ